jgi:hypothetical protein
LRFLFAVATFAGFIAVRLTVFFTVIAFGRAWRA